MGYLLDTCVVSDFVKGEENTLDVEDFQSDVKTLQSMGLL